MRLRLNIITAATVFVGLATAAPASAAMLDDPVPAGRTTTVEAACVGAGHIALTVTQPAAGPVKVTAAVSGVPVDSVLDGKLTVTSATGAAGGDRNLARRRPTRRHLDPRGVGRHDHRSVANADFTSQDGKSGLHCAAARRPAVPANLGQPQRAQASGDGPSPPTTNRQTRDKGLKKVRVKEHLARHRRLDRVLPARPNRPTATRKVRPAPAPRGRLRALAFVGGPHDQGVVSANHTGKGLRRFAATKALLSN